MMSRSKIKSIVYHGETCLGEVEVISMKNQQNFYLLYSKFKVLRISHLSPPGERCPPLSILQTISPFSVRCKIQAKTTTPDSPIHRLYMTCFQEYRSAVVVNGSEDLHLVAMPSQAEQAPCFWCFSVQAGLYNPCLGMLNLRCLAIVFDLDETLIVANTMKSFDGRIDALSRKIDAESDSVRVSGMSAELKRYVEDRKMLKQYIENDTIIDNGVSISAQNEQVLQPPGAENHAFRPVVRLPDLSIVLTRINPEIRDTSVFVRLRPAWEDLRSYLTAKGRKRFEVYVCTMAERDYALEMWRLLDPESNLICTSQLSSRITCVKPGFRKSLMQVFQDGACHPKMAMVIDDRLQVWDDRDQPRVHVVPPFTPYYAPQAEMANAVPVLCVARNVACNVRGGFFREFDENLMRKMFEICYENEASDLPYSPDVSDYVVSEDKSGMQNNIQEPPIPAEGMMGSEVEERLRQATYPGNGSHTRDQAHPQSIVNGSSQNGAVVRGQGSSNMHEPTVILALLQIGRICESKVEFKPVVGSSKDLMFSVEVLFDNERIGVGMGKTRKEAETQAADNGLHYLSDGLGDFEPSFAPKSGDVHYMKDSEESFENKNGFLADDDIDPIFGKPVQQNSICDTSGLLPECLISEKLSSLLSSIEELCVNSEKLVFQNQPSASVPLDEGKYYFQLELSGEILGRGTGSSIEEAKFLEAEAALKTLKTAVATGEKSVVYLHWKNTRGKTLEKIGFTQQEDKNLASN